MLYEDKDKEYTDNKILNKEWAKQEGEKYVETHTVTTTVNRGVAGYYPPTRDANGYGSYAKPVTDYTDKKKPGRPKKGEEKKLVSEAQKKEAREKQARSDYKTEKEGYYDYVSTHPSATWSDYYRDYYGGNY